MKTHLRLIIASLLLAGTTHIFPGVSPSPAGALPPIEPLPAVSGTVAGGLSGEFEVNSSGSAQYEIPLSLSPGIAGLAPDLALEYNSSHSDGILGVGWSLTGLSMVSRCPATTAQDGLIDGVDFDLSDRFCLDDEKLLLAGGVYGANGAEYRTEIESFTKVISQGQAGVGPASFIAYRKDGLIYEYGTVSNAQQTSVGQASIISWRLNKVSDRLGNYYTIQYENFASIGENRISSIQYTGNLSAAVSPPNLIQFVYDNRPDPIPGFLSGVAITASSRLREIQLLQGGTIFRKYLLSYEQGGATARSRLTRIEQCDGAGVCLPPAAFGWREVQNKIAGVLPAGDGGAERWSTATWMPRPRDIADVTGDGINDLISFQTDGLYVWRSNGSGISSVERWSTAAWDWRQRLTADIDGDGLSDFVTFQSDGLWVWRSTGTGIVGPTRWSTAPWDNRQRAAADVNGDGLSDFVSFQTDGLYVWISNGSGFSSVQQWSTAPWDWRRREVADVNADGLADFITFQSDGLYVWLSNGTGISSVERWSTAPWDWRQLAITDFNGDGINDFATFQSDGLWVWVSTGTGFSSVTQWAMGAWDTKARAIADMNGDGLSDVMTFQTDGLFVWLSARAGFTGPTRWSSLTWNRDFAVADMNGDGKGDFLSFQTDGLWVWPSEFGVSDYVTMITDSFGKVTSVSYKPLTNGSVYTKGTGAAYPEVDLQVPVWVVSDVATSNGRGGFGLESFTYKGLRADLRRRDLSSFQSIERTDLEAGLKVITYYRQDFPFRALSSKQEMRLLNGVMVTLKEDLWSSVAQPSGSRLVYSATTWETWFDLNGAQIKAATTLRVIDAYGNTTLTTIYRSDGSSQNVVNTYQNDVANWWLGKLTQVKTNKTAYNPALRSRRWVRFPSALN